MQSALRRSHRCIAQQFHRTFRTASASAAPAAPNAVLPEIHVLRLDHLRLPIASQLRIEEALLRGSTAKHRNYFLLNQPPEDEKTIVMGISNKTELLVHLDAAERDDVKILRRFSGGGTVYIDSNCWMSTMIINKNEDDAEADPTAAASTAQAKPVLHSAPGFDGVPGLVHPSTVITYPNRLMDWTRDFYAPVFTPSSAPAAASTSSTDASSAPPFSLTGSDYCFAHRKFGGNAQTITKRRWLHHTSFLWTLDSLGKISEYLRIPAKQPEYRKGRTHAEFLISLQDVWHEVAPSTALGSEEFNETNEPCEDPLFQSSYLPMAADPSAGVPAALPSRMLRRLSHFFTLRYPSLSSIAELVRQYDGEAQSSMKWLEYGKERERIRQQEEEKKLQEEAKKGTSP
jgi:lipoate-protein ligase A